MRFNPPSPFFLFMHCHSVLHVCLNIYICFYIDFSFTSTSLVLGVVFFRTPCIKMHDSEDFFQLFC